ncbi:MAG: hypothetical protein QOE92_1839 [Chloroflexota bacterium]|jgi:hypothetical protein|nr:hypothetical protein [Chloroflexota bacterium]
MVAGGLAVVALATAGCQSSGPSPAASGSTAPATAAPTPSIASTASPGGPVGARCTRAHLEVVILSGAAASGIHLWLAARNTADEACSLTGYFGAARVDAAGHAVKDAQRTTDTYFGAAPAPHAVTLPPGRPALRPDGGVPSGGAAVGYGYFHLVYGTSCADGSQQRERAWSLIPPDDTEALVLPDGSGSPIVCAPQVTPVDDQPQLRTE